MIGDGIIQERDNPKKTFNVAELMNKHSVCARVNINPLFSYPETTEVHRVGDEIFLSSISYSTDNITFGKTNSSSTTPDLFPLSRPTTATLDGVVINIGEPERGSKLPPNYLGRAVFDKKNQKYYFEPAEEI